MEVSGQIQTPAALPRKGAPGIHWVLLDYRPGINRPFHFVRPVEWPLYTSRHPDTITVRKLPVFYVWVQNPETNATVACERFCCGLEERKLRSMSFA
jgi:hypothetical protein